MVSSGVWFFFAMSASSLARDINKHLGPVVEGHVRLQEEAEIRTPDPNGEGPAQLVFRSGAEEHRHVFLVEHGCIACAVSYY